MEAVGIRGDQISVVYFNDDPVRAGFIPGFGGAYSWPLDIRRAYKDMVTELRRQLGEASVTFTSLADVESRFVEDLSLKRVALLEWLSISFPRHTVAGDLACLIAYTGRLETDPTGDDFRRTWRTFERASLALWFTRFGKQPKLFEEEWNVMPEASAGSANGLGVSIWLIPLHRRWAVPRRTHRWRSFVLRKSTRNSGKRPALLWAWNAGHFLTRSKHGITL